MRLSAPLFYGAPAMSVSPQESFAPTGLLAPAVAAAISAAFLAGAFALASLGPGGGMAAIFPSICGLGVGLTSIIWLRRDWRRDRGQDRVRRAAWIGVTAALLLPFAFTVGVLLFGLATVVLFVRP